MRCVWHVWDVTNPQKQTNLELTDWYFWVCSPPCVLMGAVSADCKRKDLSLRNPFVSSCCSWSDPLSGGLGKHLHSLAEHAKLGHKNYRFNIGVLNIILSSLVLCNLSRSQHYCHLINAVVRMIFQFHNYFLNKYNHNYSNKILF